MIEMKTIAGKHTCGKRMSMRVADDEKENKFWIIYGLCKKCDVIIASALFLYEPREFVDFIIDYEKIVDVSKRWTK